MVLDQDLILIDIRGGRGRGRGRIGGRGRGF